MSVEVEAEGNYDTDDEESVGPPRGRGSDGSGRRA